MKESEDIRKEQQIMIETQHRKIQKYKVAVKKQVNENKNLNERIQKQAQSLKITESKQAKQRPLMPSHRYQ